jgi:hypothetical protein
VEQEQRGADRAAYGKQVLKELAERLSTEFGSGFSRSNLEYIYSAEIDEGEEVDP